MKPNTLLKLSLSIVYPSVCALCGSILSDETAVTIGLCPECLTHLSVGRIKGPVCSICGTPLTSEFSVCSNCRQRKFHFDSHRSIFIYEGPVKTLIRSYKFHSRKQLAYTWAGYISAFNGNGFADFLIVPVPGRRKSVKRRGWDQMKEICRILQRKYHCNVEDVLVRSGGRSQKKLSGASRTDNLHGHIDLRGKVKKSRVLLIDDVFTTGATIDECSRVLKISGVQEVHGLTLARTPLVPPDFSLVARY